MAVVDAVWGREVTISHSSAVPIRVYAARRQRVSDMLIDARRFGDRIHVVDGEDRLTFAQHELAVGRVARVLRRHGVGPGSRVMLLGWNGLAWVLAYWAVHRLGGVVVLGNPWTSESETHEILTTTRPALTLVDAELHKRLPPGAPALTLHDVRDAALDPVLTPHLDDPDVCEDDPAVIMFSAGTTGVPKGVVLAQRAVLVNVQNVLNISQALPHELDAGRAQNVSLHTLPLFHAGGLQTLGVNLMAGSRMVFLGGRFEPARALQMIERERVTHWAGVPTMLTRMMDHPDLVRRDITSLRSVVLAGADIPQPVRDRIATRFPGVRTGGINYGLTEAGGTVCSATAKQALKHPGTVGQPVPVAEIRIVPDPDLGGAGVGLVTDRRSGFAGEQVGEILVRSPGLMLGYWGEEANPVIDGWLATGDLGYLDADGWLYLAGRKKDIIIRGGENIASVPIEERLRAHHDVQDAAVVGLAHADLGEEVGAVVVPRPGANLDIDDLKAFVAVSVARFAVPTRWWIRREELPTSAVGKVLKRSLREEFPPS